MRDGKATLTLAERGVQRAGGRRRLGFVLRPGDRGQGVAGVAPGQLNLEQE